MNNTSWRNIFPHFFIILIASLLLNACEDRSISPLEESSGTYSVYGVLDIGKDPNYIRVRDLTVPFLTDSAKNLDAVVTFEDLAAGTESTLRDTVVNFSGNITHNFIVEQQLQPDQAYMLTVERSDGVRVTSTAYTPGVTVVELSERPNQNGDINVGCFAPLTFTFKNVVEPEFVRMEVGFLYEGTTHWAEVGKVAQLEHVAGRDETTVTMTPTNLLVEVFPPGGIDNPALNPRFLTPTVRCDELDSDLVRLRYIHFGPEWASIDEQKVGALNPLESPVINDGLGFLGALRRGAFSFNIAIPPDN